MIIIGHRGARAEAPENTLSGFQLAVAAGILHFELDVQLSKDGQLMVLHDPTVTRTTGNRGHIASYTRKELSKMDARKNVAGWPVFQGIPALEDVLNCTPEACTFQFEVKTDRRTRLLKLCSELVLLFAERDLYQRVRVTSSDSKVLKRLRQVAPSIQTGLVAEHRFPDPVKRAVGLGCTYLCARYQLLTRRLINHAHDRHLHVSAWTVNELGIAEKLRCAGVDSVITDYPTSMYQHFATGLAPD